MFDRNTLTEMAGDGVGWLFIALGIKFSYSDYVGGLFFAAAVAMLARHLFPTTERRAIWWSLLSTFVVATMGVEFYVWNFPENRPIPIQIFMGFMGLFARVLVHLLVTVTMRAEERGVEIADGVITAVLTRISAVLGRGKE